MRKNRILLWKCGGYMLVYIVDDSEDIIEVEKNALERMGFEVEGFMKSRPFFERVRVQKPDMILLDIFIYEENGYDVLSRLRAGNDTKNIPVIMVSACDSEYDKTKGLLPFEIGVRKRLIKLLDKMPIKAIRFVLSDETLQIYNNLMYYINKTNEH